MNITRETIKNTLRTVMAEETEYQTFFKKALEKAGKSIPSMSDEEKKEFFNKIDAAWNAKGEKNEELKGDQHKLDVDGDGEIEASDLAALRAGKKKEESVNESAGCGCGCGCGLFGEHAVIPLVKSLGSFESTSSRPLEFQHSLLSEKAILQKVDYHLSRQLCCILFIYLFILFVLHC